MSIEVPKANLNEYGRLGWQERREIVLLRCPNGHIGDISDHTILLDGTVEPSVQCPKCSWHETVKLIGYDFPGQTA